MAERIRRSAEERIVELKEKIKKQEEAKAASDQKIAQLNRRIEEIKHPKKRMNKAGKIKALLVAASKDMTPEEIAQKLGITIEE